MPGRLLTHSDAGGSGPSTADQSRLWAHHITRHFDSTVSRNLRIHRRLSGSNWRIYLYEPLPRRIRRALSMVRFSVWPCYMHALCQASTEALSRPARQHLSTRRFCLVLPRPSYLGPKPAARRLRTVTTMSGVPPPKFAAGSEETGLAPKLRPLLASEGGRWALISSGEGIERSFKFKTFAKTWVRLLVKPTGSKTTTLFPLRPAI